MVAMTRCTGIDGMQLIEAVFKYNHNAKQKAHMQCALRNNSWKFHQKKGIFNRDSR